MESVFSAAARRTTSPDRFAKGRPRHATMRHQPRATASGRHKMLIVTRLFSAPITPEQPGESAPHEGDATRRRQHAVGDHHPLDRPREHACKCRARCPSADETRTPVARRTGMGSDYSAEPGRDATPPLEPVARKILDQIRKQRRTALTVEKHDLGERKASRAGRPGQYRQPMRARAHRQARHRKKDPGVCAVVSATRTGGPPDRRTPTRQGKGDAARLARRGGAPARARRPPRAARSRARRATRRTGFRRRAGSPPCAWSRGSHRTTPPGRRRSRSQGRTVASSVDRSSGVGRFERDAMLDVDTVHWHCPSLSGVQPFGLPRNDGT
jgi:hypothetical protein